LSLSELADARKALQGVCLMLQGVCLMRQLQHHEIVVLSDNMAASFFYNKKGSMHRQRA
jgi:hypothetical protein